jgi:hypothetical protein
MGMWYMMVAIPDTTDYKPQFYLLRYNAPWSVENQLTFWRNMPPPSSGSKK